MRLKNILLAVKDVEVSKVFYRELFGLVPVRDFGKNVILTQGLVLQEQTGWKELTGKNTVFKNHAMELYFETGDIDVFLKKAEMCGIGLSYVNEMQTDARGRRVLRIYDPDGHVIEIGEAFK